MLPTSDPIQLHCTFASLRVVLLAQSASLACFKSLDGRFRSTCLGHAMLVAAMLFEIAPFYVTASEAKLLVEAHLGVLSVSTARNRGLEMRDLGLRD